MATVWHDIAELNPHPHPPLLFCPRTRWGITYDGMQHGVPGIPKTGLVVTVRCIIFLQDNRVSEEEAWPLLNNKGCFLSCVICLFCCYGPLLHSSECSSAMSSSFSRCSSCSRCWFCSNLSSNHCSKGPLTADIWLHRFLVKTVVEKEKKKMRKR